MKTIPPLILSLALIGFSVPALADPAYKMIEMKTEWGKISYPQISGLADKNIETSINKIIADEAAQWQCEEGSDPDGKSFDAWGQVRTLNDTTLSYTTNVDYYCGGAYPDAHTKSRNFDLSTGAPLYVEHLFTDELSGEKLTAFLVKRHKFDTEGCEDSYEDVNWDYYLEDGNAVFLARLPHVSQVCVEEISVPYKDLEPYFPQPQLEMGE